MRFQGRHYESNGEATRRTHLLPVVDDAEPDWVSTSRVVAIGLAGILVFYFASIYVLSVAR